MTETEYKLNKDLSHILKGGVIMDVTTPEQAVIAESAGACAVMALERVPADIRAAGGVSRMSDPKIIKEIYVIIFKILWKAGLSILPKKLPNKIAIPWLKNEPSATPKIIT